MDERCDCCRFFKAREGGHLQEDDGDGKCRRYPPVLITGLDEEAHWDITGIAGNETDFFAQPYVCGYCWCGEWKAMTVNTGYAT
jgi:hypothetical protein